MEADSKSDCELQAAKSLNNECYKVQQNPTTPKRSTKPLAVKLNELFDDSSNELMLECSQMVEEQLKNGEINVDRVVSIQIPNKKHNLSPDYEPNKVRKKVKSKLNLFSEVPKGVDTEPKPDIVEGHKFVLRSPKSEQLKHHSSCVMKSNVISSIEEKNDCNKNSLAQNDLNNTNSNLSNITNRDNVLSNTRESAKIGSSRDSIPGVPKQPIDNVNCSALERRMSNKNQQVTLSNNSVKPNNITQRKYAQENINNNIYDSVDKFRRNSKGLCHSNQNQNLYKGNQPTKNVAHCLSTTSSTANDRIGENKSPHTELTNKAQETKQKADDFTSLLEDGFDSELSSLDVDSICRNTEVPVMPKVCTKAEIEAPVVPKVCTKAKIEAPVVPKVCTKAEIEAPVVPTVCTKAEIEALVVPKVCTKAEIEAKRLVALSRLKMKMKK